MNGLYQIGGPNFPANWNFGYNSGINAIHNQQNSNPQIPSVQSNDNQSKQPQSVNVEQQPKTVTAPTSDEIAEKVSSLLSDPKVFQKLALSKLDNAKSSCKVDVNATYAQDETVDTPWLQNNNMDSVLLSSTFDTANCASDSENADLNSYITNETVENNETVR